MTLQHVTVRGRAEVVSTSASPSPAGGSFSLKAQILQRPGLPKKPEHEGQNEALFLSQRAVLKALGISPSVSWPGKGSQLPPALLGSAFCRGCYLRAHPGITLVQIWLLLLLTPERKTVTCSQRGGKQTSSEQKA